VELVVIIVPFPQLKNTIEDIHLQVLYTKLTF